MNIHNDCEEVGWLSKEIIDKLNINNIDINTPIYLGKSNITHMMISHPDDYKKYGNSISNIINSPDYGYLSKKDNSIELIKEFKVDNEYVRVALRISNNNVLYARTLFIVSKIKMLLYLKNKKMIKF